MQDDSIISRPTSRRSVLLKGGAVAAAGAAGMALLGADPAAADTAITLNVYGVTFLMVENVDVDTFSIDSGTKAYLSAQTTGSQNGFYSGTETTISKDSPQPSDPIFLLGYSCVNFPDPFPDPFPTSIGFTVVIPGSDVLLPEVPFDTHNVGGVAAPGANIASSGTGFDGVSALVTVAGEFSGTTDGSSQVAVDFGRTFNGVLSTLFTFQSGDEIVELHRTDAPSTTGMTLDVTQGGTPVGSGVSVTVDWLAIGW